LIFLIRTVDLTAAGREIVRERIVEKDMLVVGRAADNDIHLPDLAVEQHHVQIQSVPSGHLRIEAVGTLGFGIDGRSANSAVVNAHEGAELSLGSAILSITQDNAGPVTITVRQRTVSEGKTDVLRGFALASALPSKRVMSWSLLGAILLVFLAIPIVSHLTRERIAPDKERTGQVMLDSSWSTGALSLAHHGLEDNCESCHVDAFVAVRDSTCLTCHEDIGDHASETRLAKGRARFGLGEGFQWAVAGMFGKEGPGACTTCHTEHEGPTRMQPASQQFCADCHTTLDTRLADTQLGNASDFGNAHPEFKAAIFTALRQDKARRISLGDKPREASGLKFPHKLHLDPQGGPARMAINLGRQAGYGDALTCKDCHKPSESGTGFRPIDMEEDCESCHSLVYDQVGGTFRTLRHGDVDQLLADLRAADRFPHQPVVTGRNRPGAFGRGGLYYQNFGPPIVSRVGVDRALAPGGVCGECHLPALTNGRPDIMPVNLPKRFFLHGGFSHAAHKQEKCSSCHRAETSTSSSDLLLPDIASCRECHQGEQALKSEVPSSCAMCHSYHVPGGPMPQDHPRRRSNTVAILNRLGL